MDISNIFLMLVGYAVVYGFGIILGYSIGIAENKKGINNMAKYMIHDYTNVTDEELKNNDFSRVVYRIVDDTELFSMLDEIYGFKVYGEGIDYKIAVYSEDDKHCFLDWS